MMASQSSNTGGFELLQCTPNCRDLKVLKHAIAVKELTNHISIHGKIYIRPIKRRLSTIPLAPQRNESKVKEKHSACSDIFYVKDLRKHFFDLFFFSFTGGRLILKL